MVRKFVLAIVLCLVISIPTMASIITTPSDPALSGAAVIDFENQTLGTYASLPIGGVTFIANDAHLRIDNYYAGNYNSRGSRYLDNGPYENPGFFSMNINFDSAVNAFGFLWGASDTMWVLSAYDASNNSLESYNLPITGGSNAGDFVGLAVDGIDHAVLSNGNFNYWDWVFVDNFTYNVGEIDNVVPVPGAVLLGMLGLSAAGLKLRRFA
jgi:hypothetical protein